MQELTIHDIKKCEFTSVNKLKTDDGKIFYTRDLVVRDIKGNKTIIALFANEKSILDVK